MSPCSSDGPIAERPNPRVDRHPAGAAHPPVHRWRCGLLRNRTGSERLTSAYSSRVRLPARRAVAFARGSGEVVSRCVGSPGSDPRDSSASAS